MTDQLVEIVPIPAFEDTLQNYIWALHRGGKAVLVDPGDAAPVRQWLAASGCTLSAILLTHHHHDHVGGVESLVAEYAVPVIGHIADAHRLPALAQAVAEGDKIQLPDLGLEFEVLTTPGHTLGHICFLGGGMLFCGDTLFAAGCGRMFEGNPTQFHTSLARLSALPGDTKVYAAHEYTLNNLRFAAHLLPQDVDIARALADVTAQRAAGDCTLPSSIAWEQVHNPFLRCTEPAVAAAVGLAGGSPSEVFAALRRAKDGFRAA